MTPEEPAHGSHEDAELALEKALAEEERTHKHDPRIERLYHQDQITIYVFVVALWVVLWSVFFFVVNPILEDNQLRAFLIGLGLFASVFNTVGMISNIRRLKHEAVRFYTQDLYWQDEKNRRKAAGEL